jgi:hypothetical protein
MGKTLIKGNHFGGDHEGIGVQPSAAPHMDERGNLERAARALAVLVREDYPAGRTLAGIVAQWGWPLGLTDEDVAAVAAVERLL